MDHKELEVWKRSVALVTAVYRVTEEFPSQEQLGLTNQIRRAAVSIPSNIAEGHSRKAHADFIRFLRIALGSCSELETQVIIAGNLKYIDTEVSENLLGDCLIIQKMIRKLIKSLET